MIGAAIRPAANTIAGTLIASNNNNTNRPAEAKDHIISGLTVWSTNLENNNVVEKRIAEAAIIAAAIIGTNIFVLIDINNTFLLLRVIAKTYFRLYL